MSKKVRLDKTWIYISFVGERISRVELYGGIKKILEDETITYMGQNLTYQQLYRKLQSSVKNRRRSNRMFESDDYTIIERKIKRTKQKNKKQ